MIDRADATHPPVLSVVVVVYAGGRLIKRTLEALERQDHVRGPVEIIVAMPAGLVGEQTIHSAAPAARVVRGPHGAHPAVLRALGVRLASAPIVACTEDHCVPARDWCARILEAHSAPATVVGGAIEKLQPDRPIAWAAYLLDYGRYIPPLTSGPAEYLSDCNVSYKRATLNDVTSEWHDAFHETRVHDAIRMRGGPDAIILDPNIIVMQSRRPDLRRFLADRFAHGKLFAQLRAAEYGTRARIVYALGAMGLAPVLVWRALRRAWRRGDMRLAALRALPLVTLAAVVWSLGESAGALSPNADVGTAANDGPPARQP